MVIAPGHTLFDERVNRTVRIAASVGKCYFVLDDTEINRNICHEIKDENTQKKIGNNVGIKFLPNKIGIRIISRIYTYIAAIKCAILVKKLSPDIVHIHESGTYGLKISYFVKILLPQSKIIFDYHDWIPYEIAGSCKHIYVLYKVVLAISMLFYRCLARSVDVFICISPGHAEWVKQKFLNKNIITIQNVRPKLSGINYDHQKFQPSIVFIGNVMRIRRIEIAINIIDKIREHRVHAGLEIHGMIKVGEETYCNELYEMIKIKRLEKLVKFHGRFKDDYDIYRKIAKGSIGIILSTPERFCTGIHQISSANKFFSFLSLGIPVFIERGLDNMISIIEKNNAGVAFSSPDDFVSKAIKIWANENLWDSMSFNALSVAKQMNDEEVLNTIQELYENILLDNSQIISKLQR